MLPVGRKSAAADNKPSPAAMEAILRLACWSILVQRITSMITVWKSGCPSKIPNYTLQEDVITVKTSPPGGSPYFCLVWKLEIAPCLSEMHQNRC